MSYITSLKQFQETPGQTNHRAMERVPFQVRIGSSFQTLNEYLKYPMKIKVDLGQMKQLITV